MKVTIEAERPNGKKEKVFEVECKDLHEAFKLLRESNEKNELRRGKGSLD